VRNIVKHFHGTGIKALFDAIGSEDFGSHGIGLMAGSLKHIETMLESFPEVKEENLDLMKGTELEKKLDQAEEVFTEMKDFIGDYEQEISKGSNHEESKYLEGKSEGLQLIKDEEGQIKGARDNTQFLLLIYRLWPVIEEQCKTRRELYEFLLKITWKSSETVEKFNILMVEADPPPVVGSYERVEKILKRIRFNPATVGRPKS
ncbi:hypothetical protein N8920_09025, partial [Opitutales bacterium]|nr:hypothetical protein [Opitutales bacterium]